MSTTKKETTLDELQQPAPVSIDVSALVAAAQGRMNQRSYARAIEELGSVINAYVAEMNEALAQRDARIEDLSGRIDKLEARIEALTPSRPKSK